MKHFVVNVADTHYVFNKQYETNRFYIERTWLMAKTGCTVSISRCWIAWKHYNSVYNKTIMEKLLKLDAEMNEI
jgi:hypothetical protein